MYWSLASQMSKKRNGPSPASECIGCVTRPAAAVSAIVDVAKYLMDRRGDSADQSRPPVRRSARSPVSTIHRDDTCHRSSSQAAYDTGSCRMSKSTVPVWAELDA